MSTTAPPRPVLVLSLDGGGVRGLSALLVLQEIMEAVEARLEQKPPLPCQLFDLIGGTGTGGVIALLLGRLRMPLDECIPKYRKLASDIFQVKSASLLKGGPAYDHRVLETKIQELVAKSSPTATKMVDPLRATACKTFVAATTQCYADAPPKLFRSYTKSRPADRCEIWEAARATSAAPDFFKSIDIGMPPETFIDGAYGLHNNPSQLAREEARELWRDRPLGLHLSLGTGVGKIIQVHGGIAKILQACQELVTTCQTVHLRLAGEYHQTYTDRPDENPYHRFSVQNGLQEMALDEWERLDELVNITKGYLGNPKLEDDITPVVDTLYERSKENLGL